MIQDRITAKSSVRNAGLPGLPLYVQLCRLPQIGPDQCGLFMIALLQFLTDLLGLSIQFFAASASGNDPFHVFLYKMQAFIYLSAIFSDQFFSF